MPNTTVPVGGEAVPKIPARSKPRREDTPMTRDPETGWLPADDVNRAKAIVLTVWLALKSDDLADNTGGDADAVADTLYEAYQRLARAEKTMGYYK